jgi:2,3-bisphosphoglycerate-dependent phosphoglycerate mutase
MKLYLLRHEKRAIDNPSFYSPLLELGLIDADKLKHILNDLNINLIFSSPFKRVLQTIKPYCDMKNLNVNIEYSLYEQIYYHETHKIKFDKNEYKKDLKNSDSEYYLKNNEYISYLPLDKIEFTKDTISRSNNFLRYIINKYKNTNKNILLATHGGIILDMINRGDSEFPPMGGLLLYYDELQEHPRPINYV